MEGIEGINIDELNDLFVKVMYFRQFLNDNENRVLAIAFCCVLKKMVRQSCDSKPEYERNTQQRAIKVSKVFPLRRAYFLLCSLHL